MTRRYDREYMSEVKDIMASLMTNLDEGTERDCNVMSKGSTRSAAFPATATMSNTPAY
jgi:hypothetical protein